MRKSSVLLAFSSFVTILGASAAFATPTSSLRVVRLPGSPEIQILLDQLNPNGDTKLTPELERFEGELQERAVLVASEKRDRAVLLSYAPKDEPSPEAGLLRTRELALKADSPCGFKSVVAATDSQLEASVADIVGGRAIESTCWKLTSSMGSFPAPAGKATLKLMSFLSLLPTATDMLPGQFNPEKFATCKLDKNLRCVGRDGDKTQASETLFEILVALEGIRYDVSSAGADQDFFDDQPTRIKSTGTLLDRQAYAAIKQLQDRKWGWLDHNANCFVINAAGQATQRLPNFSIVKDPQSVACASPHAMGMDSDGIQRNLLKAMLEVGGHWSELEQRWKLP